ncbi:MAG: hypothetical protein ACTHJZ_20005, partial [Trinickia sp.]|uniref:hypothetical protein n=1 Tax=Trinickia sp. TaxID=2571163 RepID=UPI003F802A59
MTLFSQHRQGAGSAQEGRARRSTLARTAHAALVSAAACVALFAAAPLAAAPPGAPAGAPGAGNARNNNAAAAPGTAGDRAAAARTTANQLRGIGNEEALMGGPPAYSNPYPTAGDADEARQTELMKAERVPTGGGPGLGYDPLPPGGRRRPPPADDANGGAAGADNGPARTPQAAA